MPTIDASVGGASSNSYGTVAEADTYFDSRLALPTAWVPGGGANALRALITATNVLDRMSMAHRTMRTRADGSQYLYQSRAWTGLPASTTQRLAWPRTGMYDQNSNAILATVIPEALKFAEFELAGQLLIADTTLDYAVSAKGITSVKAGSVSVSFREDILAHVLPDAVLALMPPSWLTDEEILPAIAGMFGLL